MYMYFCKIDEYFPISSCTKPIAFISPPPNSSLCGSVKLKMDYGDPLSWFCLSVVTHKVVHLLSMQ